MRIAGVSAEAGKHRASSRGRQHLTRPLTSAGLTTVALADAGVMLLLGPGSPTIRSVTTDVMLVNDGAGNEGLGGGTPDPLRPGGDGGPTGTPGIPGIPGDADPL